MNVVETPAVEQRARAAALVEATVQATDEQQHMRIARVAVMRAYFPIFQAGRHT